MQTVRILRWIMHVTFALVIILYPRIVDAQSDLAAIAEARVAFDQHHDCPIALRALESVSEAGRSPIWVIYMARTNECLGRIQSALRFYEQYDQLLGDGDPATKTELLQKIGQLRYKVSKESDAKGEGAAAAEFLARFDEAKKKPDSLQRIRALKALKQQYPLNLELNSTLQQELRAASVRLNDLFLAMNSKVESLGPMKMGNGRIKKLDGNPYLTEGWSVVYKPLRPPTCNGWNIRESRMTGIGERFSNFDVLFTSRFSKESGPQSVRLDGPMQNTSAWGFSFPIEFQTSVNELIQMMNDAVDICTTTR